MNTKRHLFLLIISLFLLYCSNQGFAQTPGAGFVLTTVADLDGNGFNSDDNGSSEHVVTNRSDTGARIDLDGDMNYEIVVMGKNTNDDLVILENTGDDTYAKVWGIDLNLDTASYFPQSAAVADSDGDGLLEIIAVGAGVLRIFEMAAGPIADGSNPSDTPMFTLAISGASAVTAGFLDADANMDIVVTSRDETGGLVVVENTDDLHHMVVCTLCSCYPRPLLGIPPLWYKSREYRSRTVREPRAVLAAASDALAHPDLQQVQCEI